MNISLDALIPGLWNIILIMAPFAGFQWFAYTSFCPANIPSNDDKPIFNNDLPEEVITYGKDHSLLMPFLSINDSVAAKWCDAEPPISYHHVVAKYWKIDILFYSFTNSSTEWPYLIIASPVYGISCNKIVIFSSVILKDVFILHLFTDQHLNIFLQRCWHGSYCVS